MYITLWILYWGLRTINLITQEFYTIEIKHMDSQECELRGIYWWIGDNAIAYDEEALLSLPEDGSVQDSLKLIYEDD